MESFLHKSREKRFLKTQGKFSHSVNANFASEAPPISPTTIFYITQALKRHILLVKFQMNNVFICTHNMNEADFVCFDYMSI